MKPRSLATSASSSRSCLPAAVQPGHHRPDGRIHDLGDLLVREAFDVGVVHRHPELLGQRLQRRLDLGVGQRLQRLDLGRPQPGRGVLGVGRQLPVGDLVGRVLRGLALLLAVAVDVGVGQDPVQPRLEVGALAERAEAGVRLDHGLLQQVLGVGRIPRHAQRTAVQLVEQRESRRARTARSARRRTLSDLTGADPSMSVILGNTVPSVEVPPITSSNCTGRTGPSMASVGTWVPPSSILEVEVDIFFAAGLCCGPDHPEQQRAWPPLFLVTSQGRNVSSRCGGLSVCPGFVFVVEGVVA